MAFITNHITLAALLVIGIAAGIVWQQVPEPLSPKLLRAAADPWVLPKLHRGEPEKSVATITERNLWGAVLPAAQAPLNSPEWRFVGVIKNGAEQHVLISVDKKPAELLKVGDALPGGAKILKIGDDRLCILINGKQRALPIYRQ